MNHLIMLSNHGGGLSKALSKIIKAKKKNIKNNIKILISTYSPTLRKESLSSYQEEIEYYRKLINNLNKNEHLIFISSQTLELTNRTQYSKAKNEIEKYLKTNCESFTILRPGMIFDRKIQEFTLSTMEKSSKSFLTFFNDIAKTTICSISDIYDCIELISNNLEFYSGKTINIGIHRHTFEGLQNISKYKRFRLPVVSFLFLRFVSLFSTRINAYANGEGLSDVPYLAYNSVLDKKIN